MTRIADAKRGGVFKRLETDAEYALRLVAAGRLPPAMMPSSYLLDMIGDECRMQRRIVESSAD